MNRPIIFVLLIACGLLSFVLSLEWLFITGESSPVQSVAQAKADNAIETPEFDLTQSSEDSYSDLIERPLFIKGRKPVSEPEPENVPVAAVKKIEAFVWEVTGIYATPKGVTAFFSRTNAKVAKDNYRKHKIDDELDGWKLSEIHPDHVTLTQAGETKILPLRKAKAKASAPTAMNANNRIPPTHQQPAPAQTVAPEQGIPPQTMQTTDTVQNTEPPADESVEPIQQ